MFEFLIALGLALMVIGVFSLNVWLVIIGAAIVTASVMW